MMQSNYLRVILHVERKKILILTVLPVFKYLRKSKMAAKMRAMFGDVTDLQQRHHPYNIPHLVEKIKGFPLKAKSFRNMATYQKPKGGSINPSLPTLYHCGGMTLRVRPRVKLI